MKTIFTVFNAQGELVGSPEYQLVEHASQARLENVLNMFRLGGLDHALVCRAKAYLAPLSNDQLLEMLDKELHAEGLVGIALKELVVQSTFVSLLNKLATEEYHAGASVVTFTARGDENNALLQAHLNGDIPLANIPLGSIHPENQYTAVLHTLDTLRHYVADLRDAAQEQPLPMSKVIEPGTETVLLEPAHGANPGARILDRESIKTMFAVFYPNFVIPDLDKVVDHDARVVNDILFSYGDADSASNALSRLWSTPEPEVQAAKADDFVIDRDGGQAELEYNCRFRGELVEGQPDPFKDTYAPRDLVLMGDKLHFLNMKLEWAAFPVVGNGQSWRVWLHAVAGKRPILSPGSAPVHSGPVAELVKATDAELAAPAVGKSLNVREQLAALSSTVRNVEKQPSAATASAPKAFHFYVSAVGVPVTRVVVRNVDRDMAVDQGAITFIQRNLKASTLHPESGTFNVPACLTPDQVVVAVRTGLQMVGLDHAVVDTEATFIPASTDYVLLTA